MHKDNKQRVIACVAVRMKSTRLFQKAFADINGQPMLLRLISRLKKSSYLDGIVICTSSNPDDDVLLKFADQVGVQAIAGSEDDVLQRFIAAADRYNADSVIRVTGDNPLTCPVTIDRMILHHLATQADYTRTNGLPLGVTSEVMTRSMLKRLSEMVPDLLWRTYMLFVAFEPTVFKCEVLEPEAELKRAHYSVSVDTPEDLELVKKIFQECENKEMGPSLSDIVNFIDNNPDVRTMSDETPIKLPRGQTISFRQCLNWLDHQAELSKRVKGECQSSQPYWDEHLGPLGLRRFLQAESKKN